MVLQPNKNHTNRGCQLGWHDQQTWWVVWFACMVFQSTHISVWCPCLTTWQRLALKQEEPTHQARGPPLSPWFSHLTHLLVFSQVDPESWCNEGSKGALTCSWRCCLSCVTGACFRDLACESKTAPQRSPSLAGWFL